MSSCHITRFIILPILLCCSSEMTYGQPWMRQLSQEKSTLSPGFYDIQKAFNNYWENREPEKGKGYKPFRRGEYFMEPRVYPSGNSTSLSIWHEIGEKEKALPLSPAAGIEWTFTGPADVSADINTGKIGGAGRINCIAFHPSDSLIIWVGAPSGGIWKTTDGGKHWNPTGDQLSAIGISDIVVNPKNPGHLYVATGDGDSYDTYSIGIIKSTDGGLTWMTTSLTDNVSETRVFRRLLIHPSSPSIMIAASSNGIYRTSDGWNTFSQVLPGNFKDLEFKPGNPSIVYATSFDNGGNASIYKSVNTGNTFAESMTDLDIEDYVERIELAVSPANPSVVYALCSDAGNSGFYGLYKSSNSGGSWTEIYGNDKLNLLGWSVTGSDIGGQGWYDLTLAVSPSDINEIYAGGVNIWRSLNGGAGWRLNSNWYHDDNNEYVHADHHALVFSPHGEILFSGNDGGISKTYNKGRNWVDISSGLEILQTYRFGLSSTNPDLIITGNQDNGSILLDSDQWFEVLGGDGTECMIDPTDENIMYASSQRGEIQKSTDRGLRFSSIKPPDSPEGAWVTPFTLQPETPSILLAGYDHIYKSINSGRSWKRLYISPDLNGSLKTISPAPGNDRILYAASNTVMVKSTDGGETWTEISAGLPDNVITAIMVSPADPGKVWVSFSSYSPNTKVYYSSNGGDSWTNYSAGLPNVPVNCMAYRNNSHGAVYAGTDIGVYYRDEQLSQWIDFSGNLPNVIVNDLEIDHGTSLIKAATYGRGIWQTQLNAVDSGILRADFSISPALACTDGPVVVEDHTLGNPSSYLWNFGENAVPMTATGKGPHEISYTTSGKKTISLSVSRNTATDTETKTGFVEVGNTIDFVVSPDIINACGDMPMRLYATGNYNFQWAPAAGLNQNTGAAVVATPGVTTTYMVTAMHGNCNASKNALVMVTTNDDICNAILLNEGLNGPFDNSCATVDEKEPVPPQGSSEDGCQTQDGWCGGEDRIDNSLWFQFKAPDNGIVSIASEGFDNQIAVYSSPSCNDIRLGNYILLAANDDFPYKEDYSASIQELTGLTPGKTYWVQVDGSYGGVSGTFTMILNHYAISSLRGNESRDSRWIVYPNPVLNGWFNIVFENGIAGNYQLRIRNAGGDIVYQTKVYPGDGRQEIRINPEIQNSGLYLLEIHSGDGMSHAKIMIP